MTVKMVLDCDTRVDDTLAILYAALHPEIELLGVGAVWGNVDIDTATRNSLHTVHLAGRPEVPVARGRASIEATGDAAHEDTYAIVYADPGCTTPLGRSNARG